MDSNKLANWLQVVASIGLLGGLVLVGFQINQNSQLLRMQLLKDENASYLESEMAIIGENYASTWAKTIEDPANMTLSEMRVEESMLWGHAMMRWINTYRLYEMGLVEDEEWKNEVTRDAEFFFGSAYGRGWFDTLYTNVKGNPGQPERERYVPVELVDYIHEHLKRVPIDSTETYFNRVKENVLKYVEKGSLVR